ncbi:MAG TPA: hypothetical protein VJ865_10700 [Gemmatimonadaceae bacterium]|nr:hypothetical protein [Gemmatimonadaceae bacterium]
MAAEPVRGPDLHDGALLSISVADRNQVLLRAFDVDDSEHELSIQEVVDLRMDSFREGNTIDDLTVYSRTDCPPDLINFLCGGDRRWAEIKSSSLSEGDGRLFVLKCATGCLLVAHFRGDLRQRLVPGLSKKAGA